MKPPHELISHADCAKFVVRKIRLHRQPSACRAPSHIETVFTARSRTRRRNRIDTRVVDLEKEVKAMSAFLKKKTLGTAEFITEIDDRLQSKGGNRRDQIVIEGSSFGADDINYP